MNLKPQITEYLEELYFVEWDRYTISNEGELNETYTIYGWIHREKDEYKDFVVLTCCDFFGELDISYITSSAMYTLQIAEILGIDVETHKDCIRVHGNFEVTNCIKL